MPRTRETQFDQFILEWYDDGNLMSMRQISKRINRSESYVRDRLLANGITPNTKRSGGKKISSRELERTLFLFDRMEMNPDEIAIVLGVTPSSIRRRIRKTGRKLRRTEVSPFARKGGKVEFRTPSTDGV